MSNVVAAREGEKVIATFRDKANTRIESVMMEVRFWAEALEVPGVWEAVVHPVSPRGRDMGSALMTITHWAERWSDDDGLELWGVELGVEPFASLSVNGNAIGDVLQPADLEMALSAGPEDSDQS